MPQYTYSYKIFIHDATGYDITNTEIKLPKFVKNGSIFHFTLFLSYEKSRLSNYFRGLYLIPCTHKYISSLKNVRKTNLLELCRNKYHKLHTITINKFQVHFPASSCRRSPYKLRFRSKYFLMGFHDTFVDRCYQIQSFAFYSTRNAFTSGKEEMLMPIVYVINLKYKFSFIM